jgi:sporulation protein YlmC with PRC-barrel domain
MNIPLNVDVHCSNGRCGRSTHLIVNPTTERLTHVVVKERRPSRKERQVPIRWVISSTPEVILLDRTTDEFAQLQEFNQTDFIYTDVPHYATDPKLTAIWPYVVPAKRVIDDTYERISPGELAVRRGARVRATDGSVGRIDEFLVEPKSGQITHLVLREGHLWGKKVITIPISEIDHIDEKVVYLKVEKKSVEEMPAIAVKRRWR